MNHKPRTSILACLLPLMLVAGARAQSFNIDLDVGSGDPSNGNGAPSSSFGGAAGQSGYWNRLRAAGSSPDPLIDTSGIGTNVYYSVPVGAGSYGGSNLPINTGDYALLLNDYARVPDLMVFRFTGMRPGQYRIYTYAVSAIGDTWPVDVTVEGAVTNPYRVTGPMPGNAFIPGITHSEHYVQYLTGDLVIRVASPWPRGNVNGFQIVAVPEPATLTVLSCLLAFAVKGRVGSWQVGQLADPSPPAPSPPEG